MKDDNVAVFKCWLCQLRKKQVFKGEKTTATHIVIRNALQTWFLFKETPADFYDLNKHKDSSVIHVEGVIKDGGLHIEVQYRS